MKNVAKNPALNFPLKNIIFTATNLIAVMYE